MEPEFQLGLVLAGGATRGAYTAGVLDYLLEVLSEWEREKERNPNSYPPWNVRIQNMVSSSAGGLAAVLFAASLAGKHDPVPHRMVYDDVPPENNLLYKAWVLEFDMQKVLDCSDLPSLDECANQRFDLKSLLNSSFLMETAKNLCRSQDTSGNIPAWAKDLQLYFTFLNMRGVPYSFDMDVSLDKSAQKYFMLSHADHLGFHTGKKKHSKLYNLDLQENRASPAWRKVFEVACASSAIPAVFPSVILKRPLRHYKDSGKSDLIQPTWPPGMPSQYMFNATDGGLLDNEPVGISRKSLLRSSRKGDLESSAEKSWGAILLIDTASNKNRTVNPNEKVKQPTIWENALETFLAVRSEATLKDEELLKAHDSKDFSQYIISPVNENRKEGERPLATDTFLKFGGALHKKIRHHDFMLGRRNCQEFLRNHFVLNYEQAMLNPTFNKLSEFVNGEKEKYPIIPIYGRAADDCILPKWPRLNQIEQNRISDSFEIFGKKRVERLLTIMARNADMLQEPQSWWRVGSKLWEKAVKEMIRIATNYIHSYADKFLKDSLSNFRSPKKDTSPE